MVARSGKTAPRRAQAFVEQPMARIRLRARILRPYWRFRFHSFGENSVVHKPVWLRGARKVAVGRDCVILAPQLTVWPRGGRQPGPAISFGNRVMVRPFASIAASESLVIEDDVTIGSLSLVVDSDHDIEGPFDQMGRNPPKSRPVRVGVGTAIGERVAVLPGSNIGKHCHVRANSVVQGTIADYSIVAGFPARVVGDARENGADPRQENQIARR